MAKSTKNSVAVNLYGSIKLERTDAYVRVFQSPSGAYYVTGVVDGLVVDTLKNGPKINTIYNAIKYARACLYSEQE